MCEAFAVSPTIGWTTVSGAWLARQVWGACLSMFLGSIKVPVPPSRPALSSAVARRPGQIRRLRRDRSHAQPPAWGASMARTHNLTGLSTTPGFGQGEAALIAPPGTEGLMPRG